MIEMQPGYQYQTCSACRRRAWAQQQYGHLSLYQQAPPVRCVDGQDGLCSEHRAERRRQRSSTAWDGPVPEGQE